MIRPIERVSRPVARCCTSKEALHAVASNQGEFENLKWHQCLERRLDELHLGGEGEVLAKAQSILDMPIRRALGAAEVYSSNTDA